MKNPKSPLVDTHCKHCKAPVKSVFEGPPLQAKLEEKNFVVETGQYNIQHIYDQVKKQPVKEAKPKPSVKEWLKTMSMCSGMSDDFLEQNWSGYTFMTEHENEKIEKTYQEAILDSQVDRVVWKSFQKKMKKHHYAQKMTNAGPEWFQDMSPLQMELVDKLKKILEADRKEKHSGQAQDFLYDLGVWPEIPANLVAKAIKTSGGQVIPFLFQIHQEIVTMETPEYEKKFYQAKKMKKTISPFSINERIVLTAVFHYHYPTLLKKLEQLLPPPYKEPTVLWAKKPIRKKKKHSSPYLEPLPINEKPWYEERLEEEFEKKVMTRVKREKERKKKEELMEKIKREKEKLQKKTKEARKILSQETSKGQNKSTSISKSIFDEEDLANLAELPPRERKSLFFKKYSECISNYIEEHDKMEAAEDKVQMEALAFSSSQGVVAPPNSPSGAQVKLSVHFDDSALPNDSGLKLLRALQKEEEIQKDVIQLQPANIETKKQLKFANRELLAELFGSGAATDGLYMTKCLLDTEIENISDDIHLIKAPSLVTPITSSEEAVEDTKPKNFRVPLDITFKELTSVTRINGNSHGQKDVLGEMMGPPLPDLGVVKNARKTIKNLQIESFKMDKPYVVECTEPQCALVDNPDEPLSEFEFAKKRIETLPPKKQLSTAIRFLCDKGDPLAVLPKMDTVPWLVRWFDKRRGIKRKLTKEDKEELLVKSQNIWNSEYTPPTTAAMVKIPGKTYPWTQKKWFTNLINTKVYNHQREIKHILIDNARDLFPSMFSEYFNTPLNKSFRKTFYAYFPARERDCLVIRPWDPNENIKEKPKIVDE